MARAAREAREVCEGSRSTARSSARGGEVRRLTHSWIPRSTCFTVIVGTQSLSCEGVKESARAHVSEGVSGGGGTAAPDVSWRRRSSAGQR